MASRLAFLIVLFGLAAAARAGVEARVDRDGNVMLRARGASLKECLGAIASRARLRLTIDETSAAQMRFIRVDTSFARQTLAQAFARLLGELNHQLVNGPDGKPVDLRVVQRKAAPLIRTVDASAVAPLAPPGAPPAATAPVVAAPTPSPSPTPPYPTSLPVPAEERPAFAIGGVELPGLATDAEKAALPAIKSEMLAILRARPPKRPAQPAPPVRPAAAPDEADDARGKGR